MYLTSFDSQGTAWRWKPSRLAEVPCAWSTPYLERTIREYLSTVTIGREGVKRRITNWVFVHYRKLGRYFRTSSSAKGAKRSIN